MRIVYCTTCKHVYEIGGDAREIKSLLSSLGDTYSCITPLCIGRLMKWKSSQIIPESFVKEEVPIKSFYRAVHGFGRPGGAPATLERARELLTTLRIVQVVGESVGQPERMILRELILENGTRMHFDISSRGACLYYIEEAGPSALEVFENEHGTERAAEGGDTDREETGRAAEALKNFRNETRASAGFAPAPEQPDTGGVSLVPAIDQLPGSDSA